MCVYPLQTIPRKLLKSSVIIKLGTVTASDMVMHHVFIILTLTFVQGHTDLLLPWSGRNQSDDYSATVVDDEVAQLVDRQTRDSVTSVTRV